MAAEAGQLGSPAAAADEAAPWPASAQAAELTPAAGGADEQEDEEEEDEEEEDAGEEEAEAPGTQAEHPALGLALDAAGNPLVAPPNPYNLGAWRSGWSAHALVSRALARDDQGVDLPRLGHLRQEGDARSRGAGRSAGDGSGGKHEDDGGGRVRRALRWLSSSRAASHATLSGSSPLSR